MNNNFKLSIGIFALLFCFSDSLFAENIKELFASMRNDRYEQDFSKNAGFPEISWSDIPELLKIAESERKVTSFPINRMSSVKRSSHTEGMIALWLIEGLRIGGHFPSQQPLLYKEAERKQGSLNLYDKCQDEIRLLYVEWWNKVKNLPREQTNSFNPLENSNYKWF